MRSDTWNQNLQDLVEYIRINGGLPKQNAREPAALRDPEKHRLAAFVVAQRKAQRDHRLSPEQESALEAISGFVWSPLPDAWEANVRDFGDFFIEHKRVPSNLSDDVREVQLAVWANGQRQLKREKNGRNPPTPERQRQLQAIPGWDWDPGAHRGIAQTQRGLARADELAEFIAQHGRAPRRHSSTQKASLTPTKIEESVLATWLTDQRKKDRKGSLDSGLRSRLELILGKPLNSSDSTSTLPSAATRPEPT